MPQMRRAVPFLGRSSTRQYRTKGRCRVTRTAHKGVTVKQLKEQTGTAGPHPFLYCVRCGNECSANAGDYFMARPSYVFTCCNVPMRLVTKSTVYREV